MSAPTKPTTKAATVSKLLGRGKGATIDEMSKATGWQLHSCRAFLTGLRKKSRILKEQRADGKLAYRMEAAAAPTEPLASVAGPAE